MSEGCGYLAVILNKTSSEIGKAQESLKVFLCRGSGRFAHSLNLRWIGLYLSPFQNLPKKGDRRRMELTFFWRIIDSLEDVTLLHCVQL